MARPDSSSTPLARKLGIRPEMTVAAIGAPRDATQALGDLPPGARLVSRMSPTVELILWWPSGPADLARGIGRLAERTGRGGIWILWPKQRSRVATGVTEQAVRQVGLAAGLVDNKVASFDDTWSALRFVPRRSCRP